MSQHEPAPVTSRALANDVVAVLAEICEAQIRLHDAQISLQHSQARLISMARGLFGSDASAEVSPVTIEKIREAVRNAPVARQPSTSRRESARLAGHRQTQAELLQAYADTDLTQVELARQFGMHEDRPYKIIKDFRARGDERVKQGDARRAKGAAPQAATQGGLPAAQDEGRPVRAREASDESAALGGEASAAQSEEFRHGIGAEEAREPAVDPAPVPDDDPLPVDGLPKREPIIPITKPKPEPLPKPAVASTQLPLALDQKTDPAPAPELPVDKIITVQGPLVIGPTGQWRTSPQIGKTLAPLAGGDLLGLDRLQKAGGWTDVKYVAAGITTWTRELKAIGVDLIQIKGIGVRLVRREIA